jgi:hypothetical protein
MWWSSKWLSCCLFRGLSLFLRKKSKVLYIAAESEACQNKFSVSFTHIYTQTKIKVIITYNNMGGSICGFTYSTVLAFCWRE